MSASSLELSIGCHCEMSGLMPAPLGLYKKLPQNKLLLATPKHAQGLAGWQVYSSRPNSPVFLPVDWQV